MKLSGLLPAFFLVILFHPLYPQNTDSLIAHLGTADGENKVKTYNELFRAYLPSDPVTAVGYVRQALELAETIGDTKGLAAAYNNLGVVYRNHGALDKALEYYTTSMKLYDSLRNAEGIATTKNNIANIYTIKKDYPLAMRYLEESYALFEELSDPFRMVGSMNNLGNLYQDINQPDKALEYYSRAFELSEKNGARFGDPLTNVGNLHLDRGDYSSAIEFYSKALDIEREANNRIAVVSTLANMGIAYTGMGKHNDGYRCLDEALKLGEELEAVSVLPDIYKAMATIHSERNNWKQAYEMRVRYDDVRDRINSDESNRTIARMEMLLQFEQKEREAGILKKEAEINSLELKNARLFIIMVVLGVIVVIGTINYIYVDRRRKLV